MRLRHAPGAALQAALGAVLQHALHAAPQAAPGLALGHTLGTGLQATPDAALSHAFGHLRPRRVLNVRNGECARACRLRLACAALGHTPEVTLQARADASSPT